MSAEFGPEHEELKENFENFMAYGTPERLDLPDSVVKEFTVEGPPAFAKTTEGGEVSFIPDPKKHTPRPFTLAFYSEGRRIASFPGTTTWVGAAQLGGSIRVNFYNALNLDLQLPFDRTAPVNMKLNLSFGGREPSEVVRAVTLLEHLQVGYAPAFELEGDEIARMLAAAPGQSAFGDDLPEILEHKSIAEDLIFVQQQTSLYFRYPIAIPGHDRLYLRCMRLLLEGKCIVTPDYREFNQVLSGQDGEALRTLLTGGPLPMRIQSEGFGFEIFGHEIELGEVAMYAPQMSVVDPAPIIEALGNGTAEGIPLTLQCVDGYGVWAFLPDRHQADPDGKVRPVSLGLEGIADPPDIARALGAKVLDELEGPKPE
jgi:hypothetical protein